MIEQRARFRRVRDRSIFVGDPDDIVPDDARPRPAADAGRGRRTNFAFAGYVTGVRPRRATTSGPRCGPSWATGDDERVCVVTVGGSGVGEALLRRVLDAVPAARRAVAGLRFVVVRRPAHRPAVAAAARRRRRPRVRPRPLPASRRLRPGGGPGRAHDVHGADRQPAAVRVRAAAAPLRAEHPRPAPPRPLRRGATASTTTRPPIPTRSRRRSPTRSTAPSTTARSPPTARPAPRPSRRPGLSGEGGLSRSRGSSCLSAVSTPRAAATTSARSGSSQRAVDLHHVVVGRGEHASWPGPPTSW